MISVNHLKGHKRFTQRKLSNIDIFQEISSRLEVEGLRNIEVPLHLIQYRKGESMAQPRFKHSAVAYTWPPVLPMLYVLAFQFHLHSGLSTPNYILNLPGVNLTYISLSVYSPSLKYTILFTDLCLRYKVTLMPSP